MDNKPNTHNHGDIKGLFGRRDWSELGMVTSAGGIGGLLTWLISTSEKWPAVPLWGLGLMTAILGGAIAGGAGVYLIANSDTRRLLHCLFFAALCGVFWKPVLDTGWNLIGSAKNAPQNYQVAIETESVREHISKAQQSASNEDIKALAASTMKVAEQVPGVTDPDVRKKAVESAKSAIDEVAKLAARNPQEATQALEDIHKSAKSSGSAELEQAAQESLQVIRNPSPTDRSATKDGADVSPAAK
jgi:hypothetical protein